MPEPLESPESPGPPEPPVLPELPGPPESPESPESPELVRQQSHRSASRSARRKPWQEEPPAHGLSPKAKWRRAVDAIHARNQSLVKHRSQVTRQVQKRVLAFDKRVAVLASGGSKVAAKEASLDEGENGGGLCLPGLVPCVWCFTFLIWVWVKMVKISPPGTAGFSPCLHLPGFHVWVPIFDPQPSFHGARRGLPVTWRACQPTGACLRSLPLRLDAAITEEQEAGPLAWKKTSNRLMVRLCV